MTDTRLEFRAGCHMADDLRILGTTTLERARDLELGRRDPAFTRVVMTSDALGKGEYTCIVDGKPDLRPFTYTLNGDGTYVILTPTYLPGKNADHTDPKATTDPQPHFRASAAGDYAAPDTYAADLAKLKTASATPASTFEDTWKEQRSLELAAEHRRLGAHFAAHPSPRLTAAEAQDFAPPDPYAAGVATMRSERR